MSVLFLGLYLRVPWVVLLPKIVAFPYFLDSYTLKLQWLGSGLGVVLAADELCMIGCTGDEL